MNAAYADGWSEVVDEKGADPCGSSTEKVVKGKGSAPNAGEIYVQHGETGGCTSGGEPEHINNKSWITFNTTNNTFEVINFKNEEWPVN